MELLGHPLQLISAQLEQEDFSALACTSCSLKKICSGLLESRHFYLLRVQALMSRSDQSIFLSSNVDWKDVYETLPLRIIPATPFTPKILSCPISTRLLLTDPSIQVSSSVFITACNIGNKQVVELLIEDGRADDMMHAAFSLSCGQGKLEIVRLLEEKCSSDLTPTIWTLGWIAACSSGKLDVVQYLLSERTMMRIEPHAPNNEAIIYACQGGHVEVVRVLLSDPRVDPNAQDSRAFEMAVCYDRLAILRLLLEDGRLPQAKADRARSMLEHNLQ